MRSFGGVATGQAASVGLDGSTAIEIQAETSKKKWSKKKCKKVVKKITKLFAQGKDRKAEKLSAKAGRRGCKG